MPKISGIMTRPGARRFWRPMQERADAVAVERNGLHRLAHDFDHWSFAPDAGQRNGLIPHRQPEKPRI